VVKALLPVGRNAWGRVKTNYEFETDTTDENQKRESKEYMKYFNEKSAAILKSPMVNLRLLVDN